MAFKLAEAFVELSHRGASPLLGVLGSIHRRVMGLLNPINLVTGALAAMGTALTVRGFARAFGRQEEALARLEALVKATGGAAGLTAEEIAQMCADLQKVTTYGDEAGMELAAMLLTFKEIRSDQDIFRQTLELAMDIGAAFKNISAESAAMQLGKAFQDPARQMTYLRRAGIDFSEEQEEMIKNFQKQGQMAEAQTIMLRAVQAQVGGTARRMAQTTTGTFKQIRNAVGDVMEDISGAFVEAFDLRGIFADVRDFAANFWSRYGAGIYNTFVTIRTIATTAATGIMRGFRLVGDFINRLLAPFQTNWQRAFATVTDYLDVMLGSWQGLGEGILYIVSRTVLGFKGMWEDALHWVKVKFIEWQADLAGVLEQFYTKVAEFVGGDLGARMTEAAEMFGNLRKVLEAVEDIRLRPERKRHAERETELEAETKAMEEAWARRMGELPRVSAGFKTAAEMARVPGVPGAPGAPGVPRAGAAAVGRMQIMDVAALADKMQAEAGRKIAEKQLAVQQRMAKSLDNIDRRERQNKFRRGETPAWGETALNR